MREHPGRFQSPGEAAAFWLNLGSKAEVDELFREWRPVHAKIGSEPEDKPGMLPELVFADLDVERR